MVNHKTSHTAHGDTEHGGTCCGGGSSSGNDNEIRVTIDVDTPAKVKFVYKLVNFTCAVIALSWFFEGWRKVNESVTVWHVAILVGGTVLTLVFLGVHSYWVYFEEKAKGKLARRVGLFEKIYANSKRKQHSAVRITGKGDR